MTHTLYLTTQSRPEVMERVLRVVRHRGFALEAVNMQNNTDNQQLVIQLTVSGERPITNLKNQLEKLYDVSELALKNNISDNNKAVAINA
ncbi:acetolactate synthase 2 small subunit [Gayadomonas joobiniege]|uniref:acetolactate synthase 2 small subunit n=1 Tax=Gayadomonas joobiniege TaxID=1234606 RepID=UPI00037FD1BE|nr:acetolactate synthase 2 small subunit [Gayadomonas joobiniege]